MQNGTVRIGHVVNLDGKTRRYIVTELSSAAVWSPGRADALDVVSLRALSGAQAGSGPASIGAGRISLAECQEVYFSGADRAKRKADALRSLDGIGRMAVRKEGPGIVVGNDLDALIRTVAEADTVP